MTSHASAELQWFTIWALLANKKANKFILEGIFAVFHSSAWGWSKSTYICLGLKKYASRYLLRCHWCIFKPSQFDWVPLPWNKVWNRTLVGSRLFWGCLLPVSKNRKKLKTLYYNLCILQFLSPPILTKLSFGGGTSYREYFLSVSQRNEL